MLKRHEARHLFTDAYVNDDFISQPILLLSSRVAQKKNTEKRGFFSQSSIPGLKNNPDFLHVTPPGPGCVLHL